MKRVVLVLGFWVLLQGVVLAQSSVNTTVTAKIPEALDLSVTTGSSIDFDFTTNVALLTTGIEKLNAVILSYKSNRPWFINISASSTNFTGGDAANPMPSTVVQFKKNGSGVYAPLTITAVSLSGTSAVKNPKGSNTIGIDYKLTPGFDYASGGDYTIGITYTISGT
ncbi:MAG TPA: hypothetical protein VEV16_05310 [Daejeonella sp.]|nr:hypothetical protein [Daejeonella sp.]